MGKWFTKIKDRIMSYDKKTIRFFIIFTSCVILFIGVLVFYALNNKKEILFSEPGQIGNTPGNLYNRGLFCESNGIIYFSNHKDDGLLYSMKLPLTGFKKLYNDKVRYINADDHYLYYARTNNLKSVAEASVFNFYSNGIFRFDLEENSPEMINSKPVGSLLLYDNRLYFQHYSLSTEPLRVYAVNIDGEQETRLFTDDATPLCAYNDRIFYRDILHDHFLHSTDAYGLTPCIELQEEVYMPIVDATGVWYISPLDRYRLMHTSFDGEKTCVIRDQISTYNFSKDGRFIFYQKDGSDQNAFCVYDTLTQESERVLNGDFKWINVVGSFCFFYDFNEEHVYVYSYDGSLSEFNPPCLSTD